MGPKGYAAILILALSAGAAQAQTAPDPAMGGPGDAVHGQAVFKTKCAICHQPDKGGKNGVGPALYGAYGRAAAGSDGFAYSPALKSSGVVWTPEKLNIWIQKPTAVVANVKMVLPSPVTAPQDRADIIAYLKSESDAPAAPAPKASKKKAKG